VRLCVSVEHTRGGNLLQRDNVVAGLHVCDALADRLDDAGALVTEDNGESTLGVLAGESVGIGMADTGVVDLDADLVGLGRGDLDVLDAEVLACFPGHSGLAGNGLANGISGHGCGKKRQAIRFNWGILSAERRRRQQGGRAFLLFQPVPACGVPLRQRHDGNAPLALRPAPHRARRSFGTCPQPCRRKLAPASDVLGDVPPGLISQMQPVAATGKLPRDSAPCALRGCRRDCVGGLSCRFWEADAR
jgi:hypothetical protein